MFKAGQTFSFLTAILWTIVGGVMLIAVLVSSLEQKQISTNYYDMSVGFRGMGLVMGAITFSLGLLALVGGVLSKSHPLWGGLLQLLAGFPFTLFFVIQTISWGSTYGLTLGAPAAPFVLGGICSLLNLNPAIKKSKFLQ